MIDRLRCNSITPTEREELKKFADTFMTTLPSHRGKTLAKLNRAQISSQIQYYDNSTRVLLNDQRVRALLDFYLTADESGVDDVGSFGPFESNKRKDSSIDHYFQQKKSRLEESDTGDSKAHPDQLPIDEPSEAAQSC